MSKNDRIGTEYILNLEGENDCIEEVNEECLATEIFAEDEKDESIYSDPDGRAHENAILLTYFTIQLAALTCYE